MGGNLFLFTGRFPYSTAENFLEDEIVYLCKEFENVYIVPFRIEGRRRPCPENCIVLPPIINNNVDYILKGLFCRQSFSLLMKDFINNRALCNLKKIKVWLTGYVAVNCYLNSRTMRQICSNLKAGDVFYSYWGKWANTLSVFRTECRPFVSRFHGDWDLWEEKYDGYAPLRNKVASCIDAAVFISQKGKDYFERKYPKCPTSLFRLGTKDVGIVQYSDDGIIRVLSCSTVYPLKRVELILETVIELSQTRKVIWTHLGGGVDYERVKAKALSKESPNLKIIMPGQVSYKDVLDYYRNNHIDVFVNLSTNEGVPVSVMEAISCNVPVVATNVGGTSEVVVGESGVLVSPNPSANEVVRAICEVVDNRGNYKPRVFWETKYVAEKNYGDFAKYLHSFIKN